MVQGDGTNCLEIGVRSTSWKIRERHRKGEWRKGTEREERGRGKRRRCIDEGEVGEISTSSITNSCSSIGCRYIQTLPRKGQSLCRPLCRPRAFLLLSRYPLSLPPSPPSPPPPLLHLYFILSRAIASSFYTSFPPQSRFSSVEREGPHSSTVPFSLPPLRRWKMRPRTRRWVGRRRPKWTRRGRRGGR